MSSSGMLHRVALVRADVLEECVASIIRATRISKLGTTLAVITNRSTLRRYTMCSVLRLLITANVVPRSPILVTLLMEAIHSS
jgi:hypothetical protein